MNYIPISKLAETFGHVKLHKYIGDIILRHSTNPSPIDTILYNGFSFSNKIKLADIGCGYGRCVQHLSNIVPKDSEYIGIDPLKSNEKYFNNIISNTKFVGKYLCGKAERISEYPDKYFELILCNYSLYFFVERLPLIVNKLNPKGFFIAITHSCDSLNELLDDLKVVLEMDHIPTWKELGSEPILDKFNAENGLKILQPFFDKVEKTDYKNNLVFCKENSSSLIDMLNFKKTTLIQNNEYAKYIKTDEFNKKLERQITAKIKLKGKYTLNKNDVIYRCSKPNYHFTQ